MTNGHGRPDLWGESREWEQGRDVGELLDDWRGACDALETWAEMLEYPPYEALYVAVMDALKKARAERAHFEEEVRMRLEWNVAHGRLTPFGRVLRPLMDRAGYGTAAELLIAADKIEEAHATERLERLMHGPGTTRGLYGYLDGFSEALGLPEGDEGERHRVRLSSTLGGFVGGEYAEEIAREAEAEYAAGAPAEPPAATLSRINGLLSEASDLLEAVSDEGFPDYWTAGQKIAEAGQIVAGEERRQREGGGR